MDYFAFPSPLPSFGDEDKNRTALLLYFVFASSLVVNILATISDVSVSGFSIPTLLDNAVILVLQVGLFMLMRRGYLRIVSLVFTGLLWLMIAVACTTNSGILNPLFDAVILTIIVAGLLINGWAALFFAVLSSVFGFWLTVSSNTGLYVNQIGALSARDTWINDTILFIFAGVFLFLSLREIRMAHSVAIQEKRSRNESEVRLAGIVESALDAIITIDERQNIVYFNAAAEEMLQCPLSKAIGQPINRFIPVEEQARYAAAIERFAQSGQKNQRMGTITSVTALRADGSVFPIEASISQFDAEGKRFYTIIVRDITERNRAEKSRHEAERLQLELEKERDIRDLKEHFIAEMSHEFRTPLSVIMSSKESLEFYADRMTPTQRVEKLHTIGGQIDYIVDLLDDILLLGKANSGKLQFNPKLMDVTAICQKYFKEIELTDKANHSFVFAADSSIGEQPVDETLLQHILINLLSNAVKYSPKGGEVKLALSQAAGNLTIKISDQGIGIPEADQKHLFETFYRASNTGGIKGTGLGLAIVKERAQTHGGTISCTSVPGTGTTFTICLPIKAAMI